MGKISRLTGTSQKRGGFCQRLAKRLQRGCASTAKTCRNYSHKTNTTQNTFNHCPSTQAKKQQQMEKLAKLQHKCAACRELPQSVRIKWNTWTKMIMIQAELHQKIPINKTDMISHPSQHVISNKFPITGLIVSPSALLSSGTHYWRKTTTVAHTQTLTHFLLPTVLCYVLAPPPYQSQNLSDLHWLRRWRAASS